MINATFHRNYFLQDLSLNNDFKSKNVRRAHSMFLSSYLGGNN